MTALLLALGCTQRPTVYRGGEVWVHLESQAGAEPLDLVIPEWEGLEPGNLWDCDSTIEQMMLEMTWSAASRRWTQELVVCGELSVEHGAPPELDGLRLELIFDCTPKPDRENVGACSRSSLWIRGEGVQLVGNTEPMVDETITLDAPWSGSFHGPEFIAADAVECPGCEGPYDLSLEWSFDPNSAGYPYAWVEFPE